MHVMWLFNIDLFLHWQLSSQIPSADVALITAGPHIKAVTNYKQVRMMMVVYRGNIIHNGRMYFDSATKWCQIKYYKNFVLNEHTHLALNNLHPFSVLLCKVSKTLEEFDVEEKPSSVLEDKFPNLTVIHSAVKSLYIQSHVGSCLAYNWNG